MNKSLVNERLRYLTRLRLRIRNIDIELGFRQRIWPYRMEKQLRVSEFVALVLFSLLLKVLVFGNSNTVNVDLLDVDDL